jgi:2-polyprenyl-6-methoxyphenol hydroxylase-like FAD-dependent oxidoreductase
MRELTGKQWGKTLCGIREDNQSVTLTFQDGTQESGDLLIGAEGAHSLTREYLLGKEAAQLRPLDVVASYVLTTLDKGTTLSLRQLHPRYTAQIHPDGVYAFIAGKRLPAFSLDFNYMLED